MTAVALPNVVSSSKTVDDGTSILLHGISWETYENLRNEIDNSGQRLWLTYDQGSLEIMPPLYIHEGWKKLIGGLVEDMCVELGIDVEPCGSTTLRRIDLKKGLEPDECYYIRHAAHIRGLKDLNLATSPPPDLVVEMDWTNPSIKREPIYAAMGVPELWRMGDTGLSFFSLSREKVYIKIDYSLAFPFLASADLERFVMMHEKAGYVAVRLAFRQWVQTVGKQ